MTPRFHIHYSNNDALCHFGPLCHRYYSATIIRMSGVRGDETTIWLSAFTAAVNFVFTVLGLFLVEKIGRRALTLGSLIGKKKNIVPDFLCGKNFKSPIMDFIYFTYIELFFLKSFEVRFICSIGAIVSLAWLAIGFQLSAMNTTPITLTEPSAAGSKCQAYL